MNQPDKVLEARQLLVACGWDLKQITSTDGTNLTYEVYDPEGVLLRVFVPVQRLTDYARGVFDAQGYHNE